jgi:hypothetical protein
MNNLEKLVRRIEDEDLQREILKELQRAGLAPADTKPPRWMPSPEGWGFISPYLPDKKTLGILMEKDLSGVSLSHGDIPRAFKITLADFYWHLHIRYSSEYPEDQRVCIYTSPGPGCSYVVGINTQFLYQVRIHSGPWNTLPQTLRFFHKACSRIAENEDRMGPKIQRYMIASALWTIGEPLLYHAHVKQEA